MAPIEFQLADAKGNPHDYTLSPHPTSEGSMLALRVLGMAGEPIGRLAGGNLDAIMDIIPIAIEAANQAELEDKGDAEMFEEIKREIGDLSDLDLDLGSIVADIQAAIFEAGGDKFLKDLLKYTYRDGEKLAQPHVYDQAYQANYRELFQVIWRVIKENGFLLSWGIS